MAITNTPLGFQKPDGNELLRNGDNVITANAQKADDLITADRLRLNTVETNNTTQDNRLFNVESNNANQDTRLTNVEAKDYKQDTTLTNHESRVGALETLGGLAPGSTTDATVTDLVANAASNTTAALKSKYVGKGELFITVTDAPYNADVTGTNDATSAIVSAEADAVAQGKQLRLPGGTYKTSGTINFRCPVVADEATINYYGTGTALIVGDKSASAIVTQRRRFLLPKVANKSRGTTAWVSTTVGIELVNLNACTIHVPQSRDSAIGLKYFGYGAGFAYNVIHLGTLNDNRVGLKLTQDETGWCNQNVTIGGRIEQNPVNGATTDDVNSTYIWFDSNSSTVSGANNNTFIGTSIENSVGGGGNSGYYRVIFAGRYNVLYNCRWETSSGQTPRVWHKATSASNEINGGYDAYKIVEVVDAGGAPGLLRDGVGGYYRQTNTAGQVIPTAVNTIITTWPNSGLQRIAYDGAGNFTPRAGTWRIRARAAFANNATGTRKMFISAGGSVQDIDEKPAAATTQTMQAYCTFKFSGTQTFNVQVYQNSGADLALTATSPYVKLEAEWLGY